MKVLRKTKKKEKILSEKSKSPDWSKVPGTPEYFERLRESNKSKEENWKIIQTLLPEEILSVFSPQRKIPSIDRCIAFIHSLEWHLMDCRSFAFSEGFVLRFAKLGNHRFIGLVPEIRTFSFSEGLLEGLKKILKAENEVNKGLRKNYEDWKKAQEKKEKSL